MQAKKVEKQGTFKNYKSEEMSKPSTVALLIKLFIFCGSHCVLTATCWPSDKIIGCLLNLCPPHSLSFTSSSRLTTFPNSGLAASSGKASCNCSKVIPGLFFT